MWTPSRSSRSNPEPTDTLTMNTTLPPDGLQPLLARLAESNSAYARVYPGEPLDRQPVQTLYGGAHLFKRDAARRLGDAALASLKEYAPDAASFAWAIGLVDRPGLAERIYARTLAKLH